MVSDTEKVFFPKEYEEKTGAFQAAAKELLTYARQKNPCGIEPWKNCKPSRKCIESCEIRTAHILLHRNKRG